MKKIKKIKLLNSAVMGVAGGYCIKQIPKQMFGEMLRMAEEIESYIGYEENAKYIKREFGVEVEVNRELTDYQDGDLFLVMKLKYRIPNPKDKGKHKPKDDDYEFFVFTYSEDCILDINQYLLDD